MLYPQHLEEDADRRWYFLYFDESGDPEERFKKQRAVWEDTFRYIGSRCLEFEAEAGRFGLREINPIARMIRGAGKEVEVVKKHLRGSLSPETIDAIVTAPYGELSPTSFLELRAEDGARFRCADYEDVTLFVNLEERHAIRGFGARHGILVRLI